MTASPCAFHVMVKPIGPLCNLACDYCYYLPKTELYPETTVFRMSNEVLEDFTRQYIEAQEVPSVTFGWQGGEPTLLGVDFFVRAVALQQRYRKPGMQVVNTFQTNGTLLDDDWGRFLKQHDFLVGLSLDGPRALHDVYRRDRGRQPTFDRVMAGLQVLKRHGVEFNVLTTVHAANAPYPLETYRFLRDEVGASFIQFIPIVEQEEGGTSARSVNATRYGRFLKAVFDEWAQHDLGRVSVQIFDVALLAWLRQPPPLCVFAETCGDTLVLEHNGDLYSCDHFVTPAHRLGNVTETPLVQLVESPRQRAFGQAKAQLPQVCRDCDVRFVCHGGCPKNRLARRAESGEPMNVLCEGYRAFFHHIERPMGLIAEDVRGGVHPDQIRRRLVQDAQAHESTFARAGRNDPCPCGGGRKFKHCHGRSSRCHGPS
ncbi:MAG: anaerobic sulfatase maturase [Anaerolineae bacterium]|jgi:uncharacterized protein